MNALSCVLDHIDSASCLVSSWRGKILAERLRQNLLRYWHMPMKRCTPALSSGRGISVMADILAGSGSRPLSVSLCPMKVTDVALNCNFFAERCKSWSLSLSNRRTRFLSWSTLASSMVSPHPNMQMPSAMLMTPGSP